ncbi:MAG: hypothetical protein IJ646_01580 [Clostridia bacterium]|nr:hypothetical protein [Clostridia bacterium]
MRNTLSFTRKISLLLALLLMLTGTAWAEEDGYVEDELPVEEYDADTDFAAVPTDDVLDLDADLVIGYVASPNASMNPATCNERSLISINQLMYESVVDLDSELKPAPMLADSWEQDGKVWTFHLRSGVQFHNGIELTAYDVVRSFETLFTSAADNPYFGRLQAIFSMEATDILTLRVEGTTEGIATLYAMNFPVMQYNTLGELYPRGTGPYWFIRRDAEDTIRLEANPLWWKRQPGLHSLVFKRYDEAGDAIEAVHTHQIGMISTNSPKAAFSRKLADLTSMDYLTMGYEMLVPNLSEKSMMADIRARQTVMYAVDRAVLASNAYLDMAVQCEVPIPPQSWLYESQSAYYYYSPERALQLMHELGWYDLTGNGRLNQVQGVMLKEPAITIITYNESTNSIRENAANLIAAYLDAIGFRCTVRTYSQARVRELVKERQFDLALIGINMSEVPDLMPLFGRNESMNLNGFGNDNMQLLLESARDASEETTLKNLYAQMQLYIVQRLPIMGLVFRTGTVLADRSMGGMSALRGYDAFNGLEFLTPE